MKKVIIISPVYPLRGGIAESTELLYKEYLKNEISCQIISYKLQYPKILFPGKKQTVDNLEKESIDSISKINSINPISWYFTAKYIASKKPDYVIFRFWNPFFALCLGFIAFFLKKTKKIAWVDNVFPHKKIPFQNMLIRFFIKKMNGFVVMSKSVENDLRSFKIKMPIFKSLHPIYNNFGKILEKNVAFKKINISPNYKYILFFGFIRKYKGLDLLLESMTNQKIIDRKIKLIIAGEFYEDEKYYRNKIKDLNLTESVCIYDHYINNDDVNKFFCASDLVVQPYLSATQSGISMISFHFNKPVLATNVGGLREYIKNGENGYLIEPKSNEITRSIIDYFDNNRELDFVNKIKQIKKQYSWSKLVYTFEKINEKI